MSSVPASWVTLRIGDLCQLQNGRAFKPTEWAENGVPIVRIQNLNNPSASFNFFSGSAEPRHCLNGGELLFAWSGTPGTSFGAHLWCGKKAVLNQHIFRVDFDESILDKRFFRFAINQKLDELIDIAHGGVGLRHVTKGKFEATVLSLPPLPEQKRIADKLDALLARVDACRDRLDSVGPLMKRFRQSVLAAAMSGRLTEEWRNERGVEFGSWHAQALSGLCEAIFDGPFGSNLKSADYTEEGVRVVRLENIGHLYFDASKVTYVSKEKYGSLVKHTIQPGDLLFSSFVDEEVRVCQFPDGLHTVAINKADCFCLRVDRTRCDPRFIALRLASKLTYEELKKMVHGATRPRINLRQLKQYTINVPSLNEQAEIVRRTNELFSFAEIVEARLLKTKVAADRLTPALLAKAFRGELVRQDPDDEPIGELLGPLRGDRLPAVKGQRSPRSRRSRETSGAQAHEDAIV